MSVLTKRAAAQALCLTVCAAASAVTCAQPASTYPAKPIRLVDLVGGHVQMVITSLPSALVQVKSGRLKALGVAGEQRSAFAPEIPTVKEGGVPYVSELWWGLAAPGRTPPEIVDRLSDALRKAMQTAQLKQRYATEGAEAVPMTPQEFTRYVHNEITRWRQVVQDAGLKLE